MISETDKSMYTKLSAITRYGRPVPTRFMGAEKEFAVNVDWSQVNPFYCIQRYDITMAEDERYMPDEVIEYDYIRNIAIIKGTDHPIYLWYQIDCMARKQRDLNYLLEKILQEFPRDGYVDVDAYGKKYRIGFIMMESTSLNEIEEVNNYRHAFRYRADAVIKNTDEHEISLITRIYLQERNIDTDVLERTRIVAEP